MLDRKEKIVMKLIFDECENDDKSHLFPTQEIINAVGRKKYVVSINELDGIIESLSKEGLIDYVQSESKNGAVYCITLKNKGKLFKKDLQKELRYSSWLILRTALLAIFSFLIGLLLKIIF